MKLHLYYSVFFVVSRFLRPREPANQEMTARGRISLVFTLIAVLRHPVTTVTEAIIGYKPAVLLTSKHKRILLTCILLFYSLHVLFGNFTNSTSQGNYNS